VGAHGPLTSEAGRPDFASPDGGRALKSASGVRIGRHPGLLTVWRVLGALTWAVTTAGTSVSWNQDLARL